jgi:hypothetical protein
MGLLDDLKAQVEEKHSEALKRSEELESFELFYADQLLPGMVKAYQFFSELIENLAIVAPVITPIYPLDPTIPRGVKLSQGDYSFDFDSAQKPKKLEIRCRCILPHEHVFHLRSQDAVLKHTDLLDVYAFRHHRKDYRDKQHAVRSADFILEGPMQAYIRIQSSPEDQCFLLELRNLEEQPVKRYRIPVEKFNTGLFERLARILVREESTLINTKIGDDARDSLRTQVDKDRRLQDESLERAYAELEADRLAKEEARLVNRLRRMTARALANTREYIQRYR